MSEQVIAAMDGRVAVVTGAGSGLGAASARRLAALGCAVVVADINEPAANDVAAAIRQSGGVAVAVAADVSSEADVRETIAIAVRSFGGLDILHNNAAAMGDDVLGRDPAVGQLDVEVFDRTIAVNLRGPMLGCKHAIPEMLRRGRGSIINTTSVAGETGDLQFSAYGMSKAGVNALTKCVATQYGKQGIRCNAVAPGAMITPALEARLGPVVIEGLHRHHLTPYLGGPEQVADVVAFLASDSSAFVTGQIVYVDGGLTAHFPHYGDVDRSRLPIPESVSGA